MNATTAAAIIATAKDTGYDLTVTLVDGTEVTGSPISVNSKGVNLKIDGKTRSFGLTRIDTLGLVNDDLDARELKDSVELEIDDEDGIYGDDIDEGDDEDADIEEAEAAMDDILNSISDGASTAEIAAHLTDFLNREITPKELRVHLRALGLGVGKGRKYALSAGEFRAVVDLINAPA